MTTNGPLLTSGEAQEALTTAEACERLGVRHNQLYRWRDADPPKLTGRLRRGRVTRWEWDPETVETLRQEREAEARARAQRNTEILQLWADPNVTISQLAAKFNMNKGSMWHILNRLGALPRASS
jgi:transposase-like protein